MNFYRPHSFKGEPLLFEQRAFLKPDYQTLSSSEKILEQIR